MVSATVTQTGIRDQVVISFLSTASLRSWRQCRDFQLFVFILGILPQTMIDLTQVQVCGSAGKGVVRGGGGPLVVRDGTTAVWCATLFLF